MKTIQVPIIVLCAAFAGCKTAQPRAADASITAAHASIGNAQVSARAAQSANIRVSSGISDIRSLAQRIHDKDVLIFRQEAP